jgi:hypothetical protein
MHSVSEYYNLYWKKYLITMFRCMLQCLSYSMFVASLCSLCWVTYCMTHHHIVSVLRAITCSQIVNCVTWLSNWLDVSLFVSHLVRAPTVVCASCMVDR